MNHPICSMYGIFTNICPKNHPNVGKYTIHGAYGHVCFVNSASRFLFKLQDPRLALDSPVLPYQA